MPGERSRRPAVARQTRFEGQSHDPARPAQQQRRPPPRIAAPSRRQGAEEIGLLADLGDEGEHNGGGRAEREQGEALRCTPAEKAVAPKTDLLLAVKDLTVSFDGFCAVDDLTFYMDQRRTRVVIGLNGAARQSCSA